MANNPDRTITGVAYSVSVLGTALRVRDDMIETQDNTIEELNLEIAYLRGVREELDALVSKYILETKSLEQDVELYKREGKKLEQQVDSLKAKLKAKAK